jgi:hypothetical protein
MNRDRHSDFDLLYRVVGDDFLTILKIIVPRLFISPQSRWCVSRYQIDDSWPPSHRICIRLAHSVHGTFFVLNIVIIHEQHSPKHCSTRHITTFVLLSKAHRRRALFTANIVLLYYSHAAYK